MIPGLIAGLVVGAVAVTLLFVGLMRRRMIEVVRSPFATVEETVTALERAIGQSDGWSHPGTRDLNGMMAKHGVAFGPRVRLVEMCKASYSAGVLQTDRHVATLMPCAVAVYEDDEGAVWLSKLNLKLMGKVFGGNVGRIMGEQVAGEEERMLASLRR